MLRINGRIRAKIANILYGHFAYTNSYGKEWITPLPSKVEDYFGKRLISYYPMHPQKKIKDFVFGLEEKDLLGFLAYITKDNQELEEKLNKELRKIGISLSDGKVIPSTEIELKLLEEEPEFASILQKLGLEEHAKILLDGISDMRENRIYEANSKICLAFDGILKKILLRKKVSVPDRCTLGKLVNLGSESGLIEPQIRPIFEGYVSLRNLPPSHTDSKGDVSCVSRTLTFALAHIGRALIAYLIERIGTEDI